MFAIEGNCTCAFAGLCSLCRRPSDCGVAKPSAEYRLLPTLRRLYVLRNELICFGLVRVHRCLVAILLAGMEVLVHECGFAKSQRANWELVLLWQCSSLASTG